MSCVCPACLRIAAADNFFWHAVVKQMVGEIIPTRVQLTFSQCQNYMADISTERNYTYFFWGHSDVALLASSPKQTFAEEVSRCIIRLAGFLSLQDRVLGI